MRRFLHDHLCMTVFVPSWLAVTLGAWVASR